MRDNEIEQHLNVTAKFELINGSTKFGIVNKQIDGDLYKSDYYFISLQNLNNFRKAISTRNFEFCKMLMEKINVLVIDKTGTLTEGHPKLTSVITATGFDKDEVLLLAATFYGTVKTAEAAWTLGDIGVGVMAWLNIVAIVLLRKPALKVFVDMLHYRINTVYMVD